MPAKRNVPGAAQAPKTEEKNIPEALAIEPAFQAEARPEHNEEAPAKGNPFNLSDEKKALLSKIAEAPDEAFAVKDQTTGEVFELKNKKGESRIKNYIKKLSEAVSKGKFISWDDRRNALRAVSHQFLDVPFSLNSALGVGGEEQLGVVVRFGFDGAGALIPEAIPVKFKKVPALDEEGHPRMFNGNIVLKNEIIVDPLKPGDSAYNLTEKRPATAEEVLHAAAFGNTGALFLARDEKGEVKCDKLGQPIARLIGPSQQNAHVLLASQPTFRIKMAIRDAKNEYKDQSTGAVYHIPAAGKVMNDILSGKPVTLKAEGHDSITVVYNVTEGRLTKVDPAVLEAYNKAIGEGKKEAKAQAQAPAKAESKGQGLK